MPRGAAVRKVVQMVPVKPCRETLAELNTLKRDAEGCDVVGIAYVVFYRGGGWDVNATGLARRDPALARGRSLTLLDFLRQLAVADRLL